jgi:hypothetical protein
MPTGASAASAVKIVLGVDSTDWRVLPIVEGRVEQRTLGILAECLGAFHRVQLLITSLPNSRARSYTGQIDRILTALELA